MRAVVVSALEGLGATDLGELPEPQLADLDEPAVLVEVRAAGLAFPDVLMSKGLYQARPMPPFAPGIEVAGTVLECDSGAGFEPGQRVAAHCAFGGLAERAAVPALTTFPIPRELDFNTAAGLVVNYHTAVCALRTRAGLAEGELVLVHGAAGGLGTAALQVAAGLGARAFAVVSRAEKEEEARAAGAEEVVIADEGWEDRVRELAGGELVDLVFDPVGGDRVTPSLRVLAPDGRLVIAGFASGEIPEIRANRLLLRNVSVVGAGWGAYLRRKPDAAAPIAALVEELVSSGAIRPRISEVLPFDRAVDGLREIEARRVRGKLVVEVS